MANKEEQHDTNLMKPVDFWKESLSIIPAVHAGVTVQEGWLNGKMVTEKEYRTALAGFLNAPVDGRKADEKYA